MSRVIKQALGWAALAFWFAGILFVAVRVLLLFMGL